MQLLKPENIKRLQRFAANHVALLLIFHIWITSLLIFSGPNHLEPLAATWFWAPLLAVITTPDAWFGYDVIGKRAGDWLFSYHNRLVLAVWAFSITVVPFLLWKYLVEIDATLHAARQHIGASLGLGGQTGLVLTVASLLTALLTFAEFKAFSRDRQNRQRRGY